MKQLGVLAVVAFACGSPPKYDGTYQGNFLTTLSPVPPMYGSPAYISTVVLAEGIKSSAVSGTLVATGKYAAVDQTTNGNIDATLDKNNNLATLALNIDQLFQGCAVNLVANGSGSLIKDPADGKTLRFVWSAEGDGSCAGKTTHFVITSGDAGIPRTGS